MSEPGLYAHLYSQIRDCAELIDDVIIDLETGGEKSAHKERETLADLLRTLQRAPFTTLSTTLLLTVLKDKRVSPTADWGMVADGIMRGDASQAIVQPLGELARALETERAGVQARIQSSYAR
jgi:hypothetical protein